MNNYLPVYSPFDRRLLAELPLDGRSVAEGVLDDAARLHAARVPLPKYRRIEILEHLASAILREREYLARIAVEEGGKPWNDTLVEINRAIQGVKYAIAVLSTLSGEEIPMGLTAAADGKFAVTLREPAGPVLAISAFNHPINLIVHQVIPAVAAGCPVIIKPALTTPRSCYRIVELLYESGLPEEWCRVILCNNDLISSMAADSRIAFLSFIGNASVGWQLRSNLAPGVRCSLEHGGAAPVIIDETCSIAKIAPMLAKGGFYHAGQVCVSVQRVFAPKERADELAEAIASIGSLYKIGDPILPKTDIGPLISTAARDRVKEWVKEAVDGGGKIMGDYPDNNKDDYGTCLAPIVILDPPEKARISNEEIFGPAIAIYSYNSPDEAIVRANNVKYAFQAAVFTENIRFAFKAARQLNSTAVIINDHTAFRTDWMPFGGRNESGEGTGGIGYTMRDYTNEKMLVFSM